MNPAAIIAQATADGVKLIPTAAGTIAAHGDRIAVQRWLPTLRIHKSDLLETLLQTPKVLKEAEGAHQKGVAPSEHLQETPESRWPEYAAALQSGALVACVYCAHYSGPRSGALGWCMAFETEACPVTPFQCRRYQRRGASANTFR